jgi:hypothetical protein
VLTFHDSVELFLNLICETYDIKFPDNFMQYWDVINKKTDPKELTYKAPMEKLNKARVGFKHHGIIPSKTDVESFKVVTQNFFEDNFINYFNIEFGKVSLTELVAYKRAKENLEQSEAAFEKGSVEECITSLTKSYACLINDYESNKKDLTYKSPFKFGDTIKKPHQLSTKLEPEIRKYFESIVNSINKIQETLWLVTLGIDYKQYIKFSTFLPKFVETWNNEVMIVRIDRKNISPDDFEFCRNFIIETALKFQDFDFRLEEKDYYG